MLVLALDAGLARFWQKRPARAALSHVPPRKAHIPSTFCEAATDVGIREGRGLYPILAEKASTSRFTIVTAEVRPSSQVRIARRQPSQAAALLAGLFRFWQKRPARAASVQLPPRLTLHPKVYNKRPWWRGVAFSIAASTCFIHAPSIRPTSAIRVAHMP